MNYNFYINDFEGPLDLLLHLVKKSKMDIYEINTTEIINQYLEFIQAQENLNIDIASEYLVMASELVHLKSKLLINASYEDEESEFEIQSEEDLKNKLSEYEKYKNLTENFRELEEKRGEVFTKLPESLTEYSETIKINHNLTINDLLNAFLEWESRHQLDKPLKTKITKRETSVEERILNIRNVLKKKKKINFLELFEEYSKEHVVLTLLGLLNMSNNNEIDIIQKGNFSPIMIEARV